MEQEGTKTDNKQSSKRQTQTNTNTNKHKHNKNCFPNLFSYTFITYIVCTCIISTTASKETSPITSHHYTINHTNKNNK